MTLRKAKVFLYFTDFANLFIIEMLTNLISLTNNIYLLCYLRCVLFRLQPWLQILSRSAYRTQIMLDIESRFTGGESVVLKHSKLLKCYDQGY